MNNMPFQSWSVVISQLCSTHEQHAISVMERYYITVMFYSWTNCYFSHGALLYQSCSIYEQHAISVMNITTVMFYSWTTCYFSHGALYITVMLCSWITCYFSHGALLYYSHALLMNNMPFRSWSIIISQSCSIHEQNAISVMEHYYISRVLFMNKILFQSWAFPQSCSCSWTTCYFSHGALLYQSCSIYEQHAILVMELYILQSCSVHEQHAVSVMERYYITVMFYSWTTCYFSHGVLLYYSHVLFMNNMLFQSWSFVTIMYLFMNNMPFQSWSVILSQSCFIYEQHAASVVEHCHSHVLFMNNTLFQLWTIITVMFFQHSSHFLVRKKSIAICWFHPRPKPSSQSLSSHCSFLKHPSTAMHNQKQIRKLIQWVSPYKKHIQAHCSSSMGHSYQFTRTLTILGIDNRLTGAQSMLSDCLDN